MSENTVPASVAMLKVLENWGVDHLYGYPGGSFNSTMAALADEKDRLKYVQIRHEQVGAMAASADAKLTGKIGVAFGSAGPGATNLLTGLYDAREDHAPVLALVGQTGTGVMNTHFFQEFNEDPIFEDVSVYCRTVMTAQSLPHVVDQAIREAYEHKGVAVVIIPNDLGYEQIPDLPYGSHGSSDIKEAPKVEPTAAEIEEFLDMVQKAKRPVFHVGRGIEDGGDAIIELSKKLQIPIVMTGLAKGHIDESYEGNLGMSNRAAHKAADEIMASADLLITIGADFPFADLIYQTHQFKFIQVDNNRVELGRHHDLDLGIWADATAFVRAALAKAEQVPARPFMQAAIADNKNWREYMLAKEEDQTAPIKPAAIYKQINRIAEKDAVFSIDVGDNIINAFRHLHVSKDQKMVISALFASMGTGLPGALAAKMSYPDRQAIQVAGDGAFSMIMQDLITEKKYQLPIINVITSNTTLNFIKSEQDDVPMHHSGIQLADQNFAKIADGMGVEGIEIRDPADLRAAFDRAVEVTKAGRPFLIDVKISDERTLPVEELQLQQEGDHFVESVNPSYNANLDLEQPKNLRDFLDDYGGQSLKTLPEFFEEYGVKL
ncbi:pyruvate oxidase [Fructobacillus sp. M1-13]|uniref:Pyruvate oxidase n=1 Tax=Fructobacillus papyriferae TaxID=2713171 RepID=A0ABS5QNK2_9LACO|nr:pyruvate oxidase [Fructobacillus papyriferae]MBS9334703.1 pyruvate oxidase [Fructobacillus papyriferae]MCD2158693.1 pyruvate oxidase [Fructobacillus papyriferae]